MRKILLVTVIIVVLGAGYFLWQTLISGKTPSKLYCVPFTRQTEIEQEECVCPEGQVKFGRGAAGGVRCATDSRMPCQYTSDCPKNESCISEQDGPIDLHCTGTALGCIYYAADDPDSKPMGYICGE